jgi:hypothetical protein
MFGAVALVFRGFRHSCRSRDLRLKNFALRQQVAVLSRHNPQLRLTSGDRCSGSSCGESVLGDDLLVIDATDIVVE